MHPECTLSQGLSRRIMPFLALGASGLALGCVGPQWSEAVSEANVEPGVVAEKYTGSFNSALELDDAEPDVQKVVSAVGFEGLSVGGNDWGARYTGLVRIPSNGKYEFLLYSDDGSVLKVAGKEVVNNDGRHAARAATGIILLKKGLHPLTVYYYQGYGGFELRAQMRALTGEHKGIVIPLEGDALAHIPKDSKNLNVAKNEE